MSNFIFEGFLLGLAYAAPIGVQNVYVISNALQNKLSKSLLTSIIVATMDISLAIACILGIGQILQHYSILKFVVTIAGCLYLIKVSWILLKDIMLTNNIETIAPGRFSVWDIGQKAFLLTWLNPHALIDGTIILGGYAGGLKGSSQISFGIGVATASLSWFIFLSLISTVINCVGNSAKYLIAIKLFSAVLIGIFAVKMLANLAADL